MLLQWSKSDIALLFDGMHTRDLNNLVSEETKQRVGWKKHKQRLHIDYVDMILAELLPKFSPEQRQELLKRAEKRLN